MSAYKRLTEYVAEIEKHNERGTPAYGDEIHGLNDKCLLLSDLKEVLGIVGRCPARSGGVFSARCTRPAGHDDAHQSDQNGFVVWTNRGDQ